MKQINIYILACAMLCTIVACKKQLDVKNPNLPTPDNARTESGIVSLAQGGIYVNGFRNLKLGDGIFGLFWSGAIGFHEMMADVVQAEAANGYINQLSTPDKVILDNGTTVLNPNSPNTQKAMLRLVNTNANQGNNPVYYEWGFMYNMINACNAVLEIVESVPFASDAAAKKATVQAWAYYWKGFAYARVGSLYYAGLIENTSRTTNPTYVSKEQVIAESNNNLDKAAAALSSITSVTGYNEILAKIIPSFNQVGKGGVLTTDMWKHCINTLKARNILVNTPAASMTAAQWNEILALTNNGILSTDKVFTGRSNATGDFLAASNGTVAARTQGTTAGINTYKLSERFVMEFKTGDKRFANNIKQTAAWIGNSDRGNSFNTRYTLIDGGAGFSNVVVYSNTAVGGQELFLAGQYEENELMKAEALINTNQVETGLARIDAVRAYQGAGLAAVSGAGLTLLQAKEELRRERRVALPFIGLSFYDARRFGIINPLSEGGGRKGVVLVAPTSGAVNTNATIEYNYLDYWDVPDTELAYNTPASGSAPVKNPK
ncbi:MAG: hypothetical protein INR73_08215 [Williamsia sp.]|nr:hypothetical protein [Williamsia sp.]